MMRDGKVRVAINSDFDKDSDLETRLRLCAEQGFTGVHWCEDIQAQDTYDDGRVECIGRLMEKYRLSLRDMHSPFVTSTLIRSQDPDLRRQGIAILRNRVEATQKLGGDSLVVEPMGGGSRALPNVFDALDRVADLCACTGVKLAVEAATEEEAHPYFERYPPEIIGFCFDSGHCNIKSPPAQNLLATYGERLCVTHLHDNYGEEDDHRLPFDGTIHWGRLAHVLANIRFSKPLTLEVGRHSYLSGRYFERERRQALDEFIAETYKRIVKIVNLVERSGDR